ncbi:FAD-binding domain-containing protein [Testicularia cyperi]|uniref:FAD-binding domain-containing protein n=1 Tax=Testicularia cyperi TaxID=1882483 RepID=A0A317XH57_9BASI|nr:FAD-binding domain-containing protein [Testicularia cyperi]
MRQFAASANLFGTLAIALSFLLNWTDAAHHAVNRADSSPHVLASRTINSTETNACKSIAGSFGSGSASEVIYPLDFDYYSYIGHYMTSAEQYPACVVLPKSAADLAAVIKFVGDKRIRFAVSAGGHASNKGFSSTKGVHITLKGFQQVTLSTDKSYVDVGPGNVWDNVYQALSGTGVGVVGGRVSGVGVGGFTLGGGGYSWITNQRGLTVDTLQSADIVLPDGTLTTASASHNPDLFWAIKGGGNRFGIVYNLRLKTNPQGAVYGGLRTYTQDQLDEIVNATYGFSENNKDAKAQIIPAFNFVLGQPGVSLLGFYDGDSPPAEAFAAFNQDKASTFTDDWSSRSFIDLVRSAPSNLTSGQRGAFHTVSLQRYSKELLNLIVSELKYYGTTGLLKSATFISYDVEPFLPYSQYATDSAWPHSTNALPLNIYFAWTDPGQDAFWQAAIKATANKIAAQAKAEGQKLDNLYLYPNYAVTGTDPAAIYGPNLARLSALRKQYDPKDVMGLTTFFPF